MTRTVAAYLAGVFDSDGTIGIKRNTYSMRVVGDSAAPTYSERIHIRQVERPALELLAATFGGNIGVDDPNAKRGRPLFCWGQTDAKAARTLRALLPFLRIKRQQAKNCLALRAVKERSKRARVRRNRGCVGALSRTAAHGHEMERLYLRAKQLNHVGI